MKMILKAFFLFVLVLALIMPIFAQEVTPEAVVELPAAAEEVPVVVDVPVVVEVAPSTDTVSVNLVQVIIGLLTAFAAGGIIGIAGLSVFVQRLQRDTATVTALELLANSWPPGTRELLLGLSRGAKEIGALGEEVFDGRPVAAKLPQIE